jgi:uncharacterized protein (UPF0305 family)
MNTGDLLQQLRLESAQFQLTDITAKLSEARKLQAEAPQPLRLLSIYNYETFLELRRSPPGGESLPVNEKKLQEMEAELDRYMTENMPGEEDYQRFIRIISVYLTFIALKPLHPPGMFNENGQAVHRNGKAVCPLRSEEITKPGSLCRFCESTA